MGIVEYYGIHNVFILGLKLAYSTQSSKLYESICANFETILAAAVGSNIDFTCRN